MALHPKHVCGVLRQDESPISHCLNVLSRAIVTIFDCESLCEEGRTNSSAVTILAVSTVPVRENIHLMDVSKPYAADFGPFDGRIWLNTAHQGPLPRVAAEAARTALKQRFWYEDATTSLCARIWPRF